MFSQKWLERKKAVVFRSSKAFTLIELLVVIAIIALLMSILMPGLQKAKQSAQAVVCASGQKQVLVGLLTYTQEYKDRLPNFENPLFSPSEGEWLVQTTGWLGCILPYIGGGEGGEEPLQFNGVLWYREKDFAEVGSCPSVKSTNGRRPWSFGVNYPVVVDYAPSIHTNIPHKGGEIPLSRFPGRTLVFMDAGAWKWWVYNMGIYPMDRNPDKDGVYQECSQLDLVSRDIRYNNALFSHNKAANVATLDGSVNRINKKDIADNKLNIWYGK